MSNGFNPTYSISPRLLENIKQIALLINELNQAKLTRIVLLNLEENAREVSTYSSTAIEGNPLPLTAVRKILKNQPNHLRDTEQEITNYNEALIYLRNYNQTAKLDFQTKAREKASVNLKLILEIQKIVMLKLLPKAKLGKLRKEPVFVNNPQTDKTIYWPPDHHEVPKLINELINFTSKNTHILDPIILAGIFHKQFVVIHPFIDGNGRCTRLLTKHLLANLGLNTFHLFSFENYYNQNVTEYFQLVGIRGNYYDIYKKLDFSEWLEYFSSGIIDELLRIRPFIKQESINPKNTLEKHDKKILDYINKHGFITDKIYSSLTERAKATRSLDFQKLIQLDLIQKLGKGPATYYKLINKSFT